MSHIESIPAGSQARIADLRPEDFQLRGVSGQHLDSNFASQGYWHDVLHRFLSNKGAVVALILIVLIVAMALAGPGMSGRDYSSQTLSEKNLAPRIPVLEDLGIFNGDEAMTTTGTRVVNGYEDKELTDTYYWFGSDTLGRDIWTRVWEGARVSLGIAIVSAAIKFGTTFRTPTGSIVKNINIAIRYHGTVMPTK